MKNLLFVIVSFISLNSMGQNLSYDNLKNLIGERVSDFEDFFKVESSKTDDNFGDMTVYYESVKIDDYSLDIVLSTEGKNIKQITVSNSEQRTSFFKNMGSDIQKSTPEKKNYKTIYVSLVKNKTNKKTFYESINDLIEVLKNPSTNMTENHGLLESQTLNATITIDSEKSVMTVN